MIVQVDLCQTWSKTQKTGFLVTLLNYDFRYVPVDLESPKDEEHPAQVAETVFRDLICRASYGNIKAILKPVLV